MLKRTAIAALLCLFGAGLSACGDDLGDKQASELTQEERTTLCEEFQDTVASKISEQDNKKVGCVFAGETAAAFDENTTCEEARDACLAEPAEETTEEDCSIAAATDCTATVDEIRACSDAQLDELAAYIDEVDCGVEASPPNTLPSACDPVVQKCPNFFSEQ